MQTQKLIAGQQVLSLWLLSRLQPLHPLLLLFCPSCGSILCQSALNSTHQLPFPVYWNCNRYTVLGWSKPLRVHKNTPSEPGGVYFILYLCAQTQQERKGFVNRFFCRRRWNFSCVVTLKTHKSVDHKTSLLLLDVAYRKGISDAKICLVCAHFHIYKCGNCDKSEG